MKIKENIELEIKPLDENIEVKKEGITQENQTEKSEDKPKLESEIKEEIKIEPIIESKENISHERRQ